MIDVIIPCYNAEQTLQQAVQSVLNQAELGTLWIIDDASTDNTFALAKQFEAQVPHKIRVEQMPRNSGVAKARNWGALQSDAEVIAFLDADDAYENGALQVAEAIFHFRPEAMVVRRAFLLACGGFPQYQLFRELGSEDGALGIATTKISYVATAFTEAGVLHYCRDGMHAERLLDAVLFNKHPENVTEEKMAQANAVTDNICQQITALVHHLKQEQAGIYPLVLTREDIA
ncbi:glycosyltransferase family A protein [Glaesserella parasuis]|uniref:glycosyltransferase family A protein n=1 Tax=Glaesserella parasuis TaxID=738 RepID=UPI0021BDCDD9|nr:glycosyltransferase family 2 protein [Glaesserella parasuis]MCT8527220.1 glycosyltransferase family 2 protein [Glaesserella parasuis]MCT8529037.1 glycosyltransferase family 2 protein [Glaesserella parasuis]MCT8531554.1 glycosyltransferase family 2 protein [Glaesserella parasuis]MCT8535452.1 glycosyltransferase family 2 protein [Glaesserella parasuis]